MRQVLEVNFGEYEFYKFEQAVSVLSEEYGYEGLAWDMVVASGDFEIMQSFLLDDDIEAEIVAA